MAILLFALVLPPAVTLIWLGAQLLEQDRDVIAQREEARRTVVGHAVAAEMQRSLAAAEQLIEGGPVPDGLASRARPFPGVMRPPRAPGA